MTREEAIALLNEQYETCKRIYDCSADQAAAMAQKFIDSAREGEYHARNGSSV